MLPILEPGELQIFISVDECIQITHGVFAKKTLDHVIAKVRALYSLGEDTVCVNLLINNLSNRAQQPPHSTGRQLAFYFHCFFSLYSGRSVTTTHLFTTGTLTHTVRINRVSQKELFCFQLYSPSTKHWVACSLAASMTNVSIFS
jgi:hypothetical protein